MINYIFIQKLRQYVVSDLMTFTSWHLYHPLDNKLHLHILISLYKQTDKHKIIL